MLPHALSLMPGRGPLLRAADRSDTVTRRRLERAWAAGDLVRVAPSVYLPWDEWSERPPWDRHTLTAVAVTLAAAEPPVFAGLTAAHLWGLPVARVPETLTLRAASPGHTGRRAASSRPASDRLRAAASARGRRLPAPPDLAPRWNLPRAGEQDVHAVSVSLTDGTGLGSVRVDGLATVQLVLASGEPWERAMPVLDGLQRREPAAAHRWAHEADAHLPTAAAHRRFHAAWDFADGRAESAGESRTRVLLHRIGVAAPTLQQPVCDRDGRFIGRTDFWWEAVRVAGEFDGIGKYDVDLHGDAAARRRALRAEKVRETRLQRATRRVLHWTWADLEDPSDLARDLREAGVPFRG